LPKVGLGTRRDTSTSHLADNVDNGAGNLILTLTSLISNVGPLINRMIFREFALTGDAVNATYGDWKFAIDTIIEKGSCIITPTTASKKLQLLGELYVKDRIRLGALGIRSNSGKRISDFYYVTCDLSNAVISAGATYTVNRPLVGATAMCSSMTNDVLEMGLLVKVRAQTDSVIMSVKNISAISITIPANTILPITVFNVVHD